MRHQIILKRNNNITDDMQIIYQTVRVRAWRFSLGTGQASFSWGHSFVENFKLILMSYLWQRKNDVTESYDVTKYGSTEKREIVQKRYFAPISAPIELKTSYYMYFGMRNPFLMFIWV